MFLSNLLIGQFRHHSFLTIKMARIRARFFLEASIRAENERKEAEEEKKLQEKKEKERKKQEKRRKKREKKKKEERRRREVRRFFSK